jgi:hypothetical protein
LKDFQFLSVPEVDKRKDPIEQLIGTETLLPRALIAWSIYRFLNGMLLGNTLIDSSINPRSRKDLEISRKVQKSIVAPKIPYNL